MPNDVTLVWEGRNVIREISFIRARTRICPGRGFDSRLSPEKTEQGPPADSCTGGTRRIAASSADLQGRSIWFFAEAEQRTVVAHGKPARSSCKKPELVHLNIRFASSKASARRSSAGTAPLRGAG